MNKTEKANAIAELEQKFQQSEAYWVTNYRGLSVAAIKELRVKLAENGTFSVVKNTLASIAAQNTQQSAQLLEHFQGPSAIAFISGDAVEGAKSLKNFSLTNPALIIKGGVFEGKFVDAETVLALADLESREVLLAKAAGAMKGLMSKSVYLLIAIPTKFVRTLDAFKERK
jgi:large subunit ribosomal protein L10